jgi:hypothetical protein
MRRERSNRTTLELLKALESILYEMVILATALLLRDKRYFFREYPDLPWGPPQIAHDVIRLKSRLLYDFFNPRITRYDNIKSIDFNLHTTPLDEDTVRRLFLFKTKLDKWTVHLSWIRATEPEYSKRDRELMEQYTLELLNLSRKFIEECLASGFQLGMWAKLYHENFQRLYNYLITTPRVEEGKGIRPPAQIDLEALS